MIKMLEVEFENFNYTVKAYDYGELQGTWNDGDSVAKAIVGYLKPYIPEVLHSTIQFDRCVLDYRFNAFATKVNVGGTEFYFVANHIDFHTDMFTNKRETTFQIVSSDEETYLKERKIMLKTIDQINKFVARENAKKLEKIQAEESLKQLEKNAETQKSFEVFYNADGEVDLLKTSRDALIYHNLL